MSGRTTAGSAGPPSWRAAGGGGVLLIVLVALALLSAGGTGAKGTPSSSTSPVSRSAPGADHLRR
ncbi:hypothetical protein [Streptomyces mirabilis]|uniref:hypothetical protein n=1 Tax=Streptomyces mirabilis TaxID=68239 RepID=UPI002252F6C1|nr:hypothetical protein [Streptomyces mirabilis]MCX4429127.1 hypothetical protein [Streptomyces mirabilis]MCX4429285.1 hypothetical protein [Streptomyces mirabilis]